MTTLELAIIAIGLSMDAFAVSVCKGLGVKKVRVKHVLACALWFGAFQGLMPLAGYYLGIGLKGPIEAWDHWIAFFLLSVIGVSMLKEAFACGDGGEAQDGDFSFFPMLSLAVATSIDALSVGVGFAFLDVDMVVGAGLIGTITFVMCALGVKVGNIFGSRFAKPSQIIGGVLLILIGIKTLLSHLGILAL